MLFALCLLSLNVNADLGTFQQGQCVEVRTILNTSAVNISTITYPNSTLALSNVAMTKTGLSFNYSFCNTNTTGTYLYDYFDAESNTYSNSFTINPSGIDSTLARSGALNRAIWIIFALSVLFFTAFLFVQHPSAKYISLIFSAIFIMVSLQLVSASLIQEGTSQAIIDLFDFISAAAYYFYWLAGGLICTILILTVFSSIYDKYKNVKLGKYGGNENIGS